MLKLELNDHPEIDDLRLLLDGVRGFNRNIIGNEQTRPVAAFLRDEHGRIVGGVQGDLWGRSMHIAVLWVDENYRGQGHGSKLMKAIEDFAAAQGHPLVYLETTSFQALPFYQNLGYELFGELPGISEGHTMFFLKKELEEIE
ncbi:MAG: GNAT family N-acetyltransferase [Pyrinomonadaceae bacterium]